MRKDVPILNEYRSHIRLLPFGTGQMKETHSTWLFNSVFGICTCRCGEQYAAFLTSPWNLTWDELRTEMHQDPNFQEWEFEPRLFKLHLLAPNLVQETFATISEYIPVRNTIHSRDYLEKGEVNYNLLQSRIDFTARHTSSQTTRTMGPGGGGPSGEAGGTVVTTTVTYGPSLETYLMQQLAAARLMKASPNNKVTSSRFVPPPNPCSIM